jgi:hypothetical protein
VAPPVMDCATKEDQDWTKWWTYMDLLMHTGLEIWITEDLQVGMCLTYLEEQSLLTTEAEYMAATHASKEAVWLQRLCSGIGLVQQTMRLDCDSQSDIFLEKNPAYHSKTKHIDVQYHFVRDMVEEKKVLLEKVDTLKNVADSLTKFVSTEKFSWCRVEMGIPALDC